MNYRDSLINCNELYKHGVWIDVPVYFDGVIQWCDFGEYAKSAFFNDTGLALPTQEDWSDLVCFFHFLERKVSILIKYSDMEKMDCLET
jgi:hypothetical protein